MKALRWSLGIIGAVLVVLVLAVVIATQLINPNDYRGTIERLVQRYTGRPFHIEGRMHLKWYPWLTLRVGAARLGNRPGASGPDLIDWRSARIGVRLLPLLLHRRVELDTLRVRGADIHLWRSTDGTANWQHLLVRSAPSGASSGARLTLGGLILRDATIVFHEPGKTIRLTHWQLHLGPWSRGQPLSVQTRFVLHAPKVPPGGVPVSFTAHDLGVRSAPLTVTAPQWRLTVANAAVSGALRFGDLRAHPSASGHLALSIPSVRALIGRWDLKMRLPRNRSVLGALSVSGYWRLHDGAVRVEPLIARLDDTTLTGWVARSGGPQPHWTFALRADQINLDHYLPPTRKHPKPLTLPLATLRALHARGTLTVKRAVIGGSTMREMRLQVQ